MPRLALLNCYIGKLPNYFEYWLRSCAQNPEVDFYLITDNDTSSFTVTSNIHLIQTSLEELRKQINDCYPFEISLESPYKLTDFKPAYGHIFCKLFEPYDYWGYCDIDMIFGDLSKFVMPRIDEGFEKIYQLGHLTVYRNTEDMRKLYMQHGGMFTYHTVFTRPEFYSFDEHCGQMLIAKRQNVNEYKAEEMADISCRLQRMTLSRQRNYPFQVFYYENGSVYRSYVNEDSNIFCDEYAYIHMQKRQFLIHETFDRFFILGDRFIEKREEITTTDEIAALSEYVSEAYDRKCLNKYRNRKLFEFAKCTMREKSIWLRQRISMREFT